MPPELVALKDADALDRVRFGSVPDGAGRIAFPTLDPDFLRTPALRSEARYQLAWDLAQATARARGPAAWLQVRACAQHAGLWLLAGVWVTPRRGSTGHPPRL
jgi:hypothetical protein